MDVLGIDVSKDDFHACLLQEGRQTRKSFPNAPAGYGQLRTWLKNRRGGTVHACMEATGGYWLSLATAMHGWGGIVSVVNPSRTSLFARSQLRRTKTDRVDSEMIAQFCQTQRPPAWSPPPAEILELRGLLTYRDQLVSQRLALRQVAAQIYVGKELGRVHAKQLKDLDRFIAAIEKQLVALLKAHRALEAQVQRLTAIVGIGFLTAVEMVARLPVDRLRDGKAAAAYVGLTPRERQSGTSVKGRPRICKTGNAQLRKSLYMPALSAMRHNPILREFAERLKAKGKPAKVVIVAVMRKLVVLAYSVMSQPALTGTA